MSARKTHWLRNTIIILVICGIAGLALTWVQFFGKPDPSYATATLQLTFEGAADGIAPNNSAFDLSDIASDEVLSAALEAASLSGTYTPEQVRPSLVVRGVYPEDMAAQVMNYESLLNFTANRETTVGDYHATTFSVTLYDAFDPSISQANLEGLMHALMDVYRERFARVHANALEDADVLFKLDEYDYPQQLEIIRGNFEMVSAYANEMYDRKPAFRLNGEGFNAISVRMNNLITSDIARLNADLTMNALTKDTARLLTQYQFEIRDLTNRLQHQKERLEELDALIGAYDKNEIIYLSTADSLTKIDGNSSETYDTLVDQRKEVADEITDINSQIATYQLKLSDLLKGDASEPDGKAGEDDGTDAEEFVAMTEEEIARAAEEADQLVKRQVAALEKNIELLVKKGDAAIADFKEMLTSYNAQEINDMTVTVTRYDYKTPKVLSGAFVKRAIKVAGPVCALGFMLSMLLIVISRKKEEKQ